MDAAHEETNHVYIGFYMTWSNLFDDLDRAPCEGKRLLLRVFFSYGTKKAVMERDTDDLAEEGLLCIVNWL